MMNEQALQKDSIIKSGKYSYTIEKKLGQGSFGITYLATTRMKVKTIVSGPLGDVVQEKEDEVRVCIKEFFMRELNNRGKDSTTVEGSSSGMVRDYREKFRKEAENLSKLNHKNIVRVLEVFDTNNTTYYVMEYIDGQNLDDYIPQEGLLETAALPIFRTVANAVGYLHSKKMLHLDIKPKNVMLGNDGTVKLIDFGLSKQFDESGEPESSTNIGLGTPGYAPIEQANYRAGEGFPATLDIYALGATLYKMLTGKRPANASVVNEDGLPPCPANVSVKTWNMVEWAMQPKKKDRPQSVNAIFGLMDDETEVKPTPMPPTPPPIPTPSPIPPSPKKMWLIGGIVLVVILGIALVAYPMFNRQKQARTIVEDYTKLVAHFDSVALGATESNVDMLFEAKLLRDSIDTYELEYYADVEKPSGMQEWKDYVSEILDEKLEQAAKAWATAAAASWEEAKVLNDYHSRNEAIEYYCRSLMLNDDSQVRSEYEELVAESAYMEIVGITFTNREEDGTVIAEEDSTMWRGADIKYLAAKIEYRGVGEYFADSKEVELMVKVKDPNNVVLSGSSSPAGYCFAVNLEAEIFPNAFIYLWSPEASETPAFGKIELPMEIEIGTMWGSAEGGAYGDGTYTYEIWYKGNLLYSRELELL